MSSCFSSYLGVSYKFIHSDRENIGLNRRESNEPLGFLQNAISYFKAAFACLTLTSLSNPKWLRRLKTFGDWLSLWKLFQTPRRQRFVALRFSHAAQRDRHFYDA